MGIAYTILYRGPLAGCNYGCAYCPFAATHDTPAALREDEEALERFCAWIAGRREPLSVFFIPRGEALIHPWYQRAMARLSHLPHVYKVAIQTNLSCDLAWVEACRRDRIGLWCSYHPSQVDAASFLGQCARLRAMGLSFSVGMVGVHEQFDEIDAMRAALPDDVYLWVNAYKHEDGYYDAADIRRLTAVDPLFPHNLHRYACHGDACACGDTVCFVDGEGTLRRCPFVPAPLGSIYAGDFPMALDGQPCPADECHCHIGSVHLARLGLREVYGPGILERVPMAGARRPAFAYRGRAGTGGGARPGGR